MKKFFIGLTAAFLLMPAMAKADDGFVPVRRSVPFPNEATRYYPSQEICSGTKCVRVARILGFGYYCLMFPDGSSIESIQDDIFKDITSSGRDDCARDLKAKGISYNTLYTYWKETIKRGEVGYE